MHTMQQIKEPVPGGNYNVLYKTCIQLYTVNKNSRNKLENNFHSLYIAIRMLRNQRCYEIVSILPNMCLQI